MGDERHPPSEYRWARQVSAVLLIAVVVLVVVIDVVVEGYEVTGSSRDGRNGWKQRRRTPTDPPAGSR